MIEVKLSLLQKLRVLVLNFVIVKLVWHVKREEQICIVWLSESQDAHEQSYEISICCLFVGQDLLRSLEKRQGIGRTAYVHIWHNCPSLNRRQKVLDRDQRDVF